MILDTTNRCIIYKEIVYKLTKSMVRLLLLLSDNNLHNNGEIKKYLKIKTLEGVRVYILRLREQMPLLEIVTINSSGYILKNKIKIK